MPSVSKAQEHTMAGVAHDPAFARKMGIPQQVGKEFNDADMMAGYKRALPAHASKKKGGKKHGH